MSCETFIFGGTGLLGLNWIFKSTSNNLSTSIHKRNLIHKNINFYIKFGYDVDDNGYLIPCEKEQSIIRQMKLLRDEGKTYKTISEVITKNTKKKFPQSWVFNILKRENLKAVA